ncbi:MAG: tetraacyldisaccharide 4'-kinase [Halofilum sp. (in: g-proteobacteria)]|nr:tetraacyldisaccharide 4'-kinase [Halofilum sp. (in: g-proteobacteria)]
MNRFNRWLVRRWRQPTLFSRILLGPPAALFSLLAAVRRLAYRRGWLHVHRLPVPVIVVGNLTVGGSGKTPLVIHLVTELQAAGWSPGVVSRGYGGAGGDVRRVDAGTGPETVGDEPAMIHWICGCPVAVGGDRAGAARALVPDCDVIVADDGLQHYALGRDIEVVVVDGHEGLGNGWPLPAGPLREPAGRLDSVDFVAVRDGERPGAWRIDVHADTVHRVNGSGEAEPLTAWQGTPVHAVAGIGVPERFFSQLERAGLVIDRHAFADHHAYCPEDFRFGDERPVLMTQKDAVKCRLFPDARLRYVAARVDDRNQLAAAIIDRLAAMQATERS